MVYNVLEYGLNRRTPANALYLWDIFAEYNHVRDLRSLRKFSISKSVYLILYLHDILIRHFESYWYLKPIALTLQEILTENQHFSEKKLLFCRKYNHVRDLRSFRKFSRSNSVYLILYLHDILFGISNLTDMLV